MKVCVWVDRYGSITRQHFKALRIDPGRWMTGIWLQKGTVRGEWVAGPRFPLEFFRDSHPTIFAKVVEDFDRWSVENGLASLTPVQETLL